MYYFVSVMIIALLVYKESLAKQNVFWVGTNLRCIDGTLAEGNKLLQ